MNLAAALRMILDHEETGVSETPGQLDKARIAIAWTITGYAMVKLMERIVDEGYIRDERRAELLERTRNMDKDIGFLTDAEVAEKNQQPPESVEDLF